MDKIITNLHSVPFGELQYCPNNGIMYQKDMTASVPYAEAYFQKYVGYEDTEIANKINEVRISIVKKYCSSILDIGVGSGEFIRKAKQNGLKTFGYDINPVAIEMLKKKAIYSNPYTDIKFIDGIGFSLWDTMEHIPEPSVLLEKAQSGMYVFVSMPIFSDLTKVRQSKHYRPNEHYYYFTSNGLIWYFEKQNFQLVEMSDGESIAGREDITTFVFKKNQSIPVGMV